MHSIAFQQHPKSCRKAGVESTSVLAKAPGYQNVTVAATMDLLDTSEDMWLLAFAPAATFADASQACSASIQQFVDISAEAAGMVKVGLVWVSPEEETRGGLFASGVNAGDAYAFAPLSRRSFSLSLGQLPLQCGTSASEWPAAV